MKIKDAMNQAFSQNGNVSIFYNPKKPLILSEAVFALHGQEPDGYLLWCDCSKAVKAIHEFGLDGAFEHFSK